MPIDQLAFRYLDTYIAGGEFPGGLSFRAELDRANLDFSRASLTRIDNLLERIRAQCMPEDDVFLCDYANKTFMYLLGFYVGTVVSHCSGHEIHWYGYDEMLRVMPGTEAYFPRCFATSISCILAGDAFLVPLAAIQEKLFYEHAAQGVASCADHFIAGQRPGSSSIRWTAAGFATRAPDNGMTARTMDRA